jgi:hypothetical protein
MTPIDMSANPLLLSGGTSISRLKEGHPDFVAHLLQASHTWQHILLHNDPAIIADVLERLDDHREVDISLPSSQNTPWTLSNLR